MIALNDFLTEIKSVKVSAAIRMLLIQICCFQRYSVVESIEKNWCSEMISNWKYKH